MKNTTVTSMLALALAACAGVGDPADAPPLAGKADLASATADADPAPSQPQLIPGVHELIPIADDGNPATAERVIVTKCIAPITITETTLVRPRGTTATRTYEGRPVVKRTDPAAAIAKEEAQKVYLGQMLPQQVTTLLECDPGDCACPGGSYLLPQMYGVAEGTPCASNPHPCAECAPPQTPNGNGICAQVTWYARGPDGVCRPTRGPEPRPCERGCFDGETRIRMADGRDEPVRRIRAGSMVFNPALRKGVRVRRVTAGPELVPMVELALGKGTLRVTRHHPVRTKRGLLRAEEVRVGDALVTGAKRPVAVSAIRRPSLKVHEVVWNFELDVPGDRERDHLVLANGVVTGDLVLQRKLQARQGSAAVARR
jgi:hypothetical protein